MVDGVEEDDKKDAGETILLDLEQLNGLFGENGDEMEFEGFSDMSVVGQQNYQIDVDFEAELH